MEAAARRSGLGVLVVMLSEKLLLEDNTTCHLATSHHNIQFYTVNITKLALGTAIG